MAMAVKPQTTGLAGVNRTVLEWTSDGSGNQTQTVDIAGLILGIQFVPGTGGTQPSNNYAVALLDAAGANILATIGTGLSNAAPVFKTPLVTGTDGTNTNYFPRAVNETLTCNVSAAGNGKSGSVVIYHG